MADRCPLCGQPLPQGLEQQELHKRMDKLAAPAIAQVKEQLQSQLESKYEKELEEVARQAKARAAAQQKQELAELRRRMNEERRRAEKAEKASKRQVELAKAKAVNEASKEYQTKLQRLQAGRNKELSELRRRVGSEMRRAEKAERASERQVELAKVKAVKEAAKQYQTNLEKLETSRNKDRKRYELDSNRLQRQVDQLSRQLEKQTSEQLGDLAEVDLFAELQAAFRGDRIERVGRGVKGADVVQHVMDVSKQLGTIVFESKNVSAWQNEFIARAKQYQTQYNTPHVIVVTSAFPRKQRGLCVIDGIPVVEPRMVIALARLIREGILEIAELRISGEARDEKAQQLFEYILSNQFITRFREISDSVAGLRKQQQKEKDWHENTWQTEAKFYDRIDNRKREIFAQIKRITRQAEVEESVPEPAWG